MAQAIVSTCTVFKTGTGKKGPWTLYKVTTQDGQEPTGFDFVNPGDAIEVTQTQNGQYTNLNYKKVDGAAAPAAAPATSPGAAAPAAGQPAAGASDPRVLRLLIVMAEQIGVPNERIMEILEKV